MRYLVTWTSPVVYRGEVESIGVYGVEGSKPGASAVGIYLSHKIIGLDQKGHGTLLGETIFTCARMYCHWAMMEPREVSFNGTKARIRVTPFMMLPAERDGGSKEDIEKQKDFIRKEIIERDNEYIYKNKEAAKLISELEGDLQINAFAVNFEIDGELNEDVIEANYLNNRIFNRTPITDWQDKKKTLKDVKLFLTSTIFAQEDYKGCLDTYMRRLGLKGQQDLYTLINVTMNPWATSHDFVRDMAVEFENIANKELRHSVSRNVQTADFHGFIIQGIQGDRVCGVHLPMFNMQNHRWQLIVSITLPQKVLNTLRERKDKDPTTFFTFANQEKAKLEHFISPGASFKARIDERIPQSRGQKALIECAITDVQILYKRSMRQKFLSFDYPENMLLYAYSAQRGTNKKPIFHVDHLLNVAVDIQLNSDSVTFTSEKMQQEEAEKIVASKGAWFRLTDVHERVLQPLLQEADDPKTIYDKPGLSRKAGANCKFEALSAENGLAEENAPVLFAGTLTLGETVFTDAYMINADAEVRQHHGKSHGEQVDGVYHPKTSFSLLGLQQSNASGLVAEYSNSMQMPELRLRNPANKMRLFKSSIPRDAPEEISYLPFGDFLRAPGD